MPEFGFVSQLKMHLFQTPQQHEKRISLFMVHFVYSAISLARFATRCWTKVFDNEKASQSQWSECMRVTLPHSQLRGLINLL